MMDKIFNEVNNDKDLNTYIDKVCYGHFNRQDRDDLKQMVFLSMLENPQKTIKIYKKGEINNFIVKCCYLQTASKTSTFYRRYKRELKKDFNIYYNIDNVYSCKEPSQPANVNEFIKTDYLEKLLLNSTEINKNSILFNIVYDYTINNYSYRDLAKKYNLSHMKIYNQVNEIIKQYEQTRDKLIFV